MKWFKDVKSLEELRKLYRRLVMEHHPDNGHDTGNPVLYLQGDICQYFSYAVYHAGDRGSRNHHICADQAGGGFPGGNL